MKTLEEAIRLAERLKFRIRSGKKPEEGVERPVVFTEEDVAEGLEALRSASAVDVAASSERLLLRIQRLRRRRALLRTYRIVASAVAVVLLFLGVYILYPEGDAELAEVPAVVLSEITVPTLLQEEADKVVAYEELQDERVYNAGSGKAGKVEVQVSYEKFVIPAGYTYTVCLADGSRVILNAGSELRYPTQFADSVRAVELEGEAFFEVAKSDVPFIVKSGEVQVQVYGTRFNFLHSLKTGVAEAVLLEGSIGMRSGGEEVKITPEHRVFHQPGSPLLAEKVDTDNYISWMGSTFKYERMPLEYIVGAMERWYGVDIAVSPESGRQLYTIECSKSSSVERTIEVLGIITGKNIKKEGGSYYIE